MNSNPTRGTSRKEKPMNAITRTTSVAVLITLGLALGVPTAEPPKTEPAITEPQEGTDTAQSKRWTDLAPADCPFTKSDRLVGVEFTGRHAEYTHADTWYPSWASDGHLYSGFTDGSVLDSNGTKIRSFSGPECVLPSSYWVTGQARIEGDDPLQLKVVALGLHYAPAWPYAGRYPCGTLVHNGIWYYGTYCLDMFKYDWDIMGPFVGFRLSRDFGKTWEDTPCTPVQPLFGEAFKDPQDAPPTSGKVECEQWRVTEKQYKTRPKVRIGAPHFVDFGKNMEHSPDGKAYLLAQGAVRPEAYNSWSCADRVYLIRVKPSPETINDPKAYEFFAGHDAQGRPLWSGDFARIKPLLEWNDHMGIVTATYVPGLKKYLMCVTDGRGSQVHRLPQEDKFTDRGPFDTYILEADALTGPWKRVVYMKAFGEQAYFVNIPSKFSSPDGRTLWLCYSHGWMVKTENPEGGRYAMSLQEIKLLTPAETPIPAFSGAEGYGSQTPGGRGGKVILVTNLNPDGPGSLQEACSTPGPRIVVFTVSGVIPNTILIPYSNITIAGQTAPGAGITIEGMLAAREGISDVVIRHIRVRPRPSPETFAGPRGEEIISFLMSNSDVLGATINENLHIEAVRKQANESHHALILNGIKNLVIDHVSTS